MLSPPRPLVAGALALLAVGVAGGMAGWEDWDVASASGSGLRKLSNATPGLHVPKGVCLYNLVPCSLSITGNLVLIVFYGIILGVAAKMISDGAELLLDLGLPAAIIGGIVLPLLGAVPDSAMIIASGSSGDKAEANHQISVGMGTLAGSTIMLLTIAWVGSLVLGRVDIVNRQGRDGQCSRFTCKSFVKQGVTVFPDVTFSAIVMLITALPYMIVQGADWHYGPSNKPNASDPNSEQPAYIRDSALVTMVIAFVLFICYLILQLFYSVAAKRRDSLRREEALKRRVLKQFYLTSTRGAFGRQPASVQAEGGGAATSRDTDGESKPLLSTGTQKKYVNVWKMHKGAHTATNGGGEAEKGEATGNGTEEAEEDPKWKITLKSCVLLTLGVVLVTVFSDPMVDVLTAIADKHNHDYYQFSGSHIKRGQYVPIPPFYLSFVITPFCSNASELVSSFVFASKKTKVNSSLTFSQLYGAATMNNTLCLGIFAALVYFKDLEWNYSAEVTVILFVEFVVGVVAIISGFGFRHTYILITGFFVGVLYFFSIFMVWALEHFADWK